MKFPSFLRFALGAALSLAGLHAPSAVAAEQRTQAQAQVLDRAEFACDNCFFGARKEFYCFSAGNQILIAYQKTPVINYTEKSKNYLTPVRPSWTTWTPSGETVPISYDQKHIWLSRDEVAKAAPGFWARLKHTAIWASHGEGKKVKLTRSNVSDIFMNDNRCHAAPPVATAQ